MFNYSTCSLTSHRVILKDPSNSQLVLLYLKWAEKITQSLDNICLLEISLAFCFTGEHSQKLLLLKNEASAWRKEELRQALPAFRALYLNVSTKSSASIIWACAHRINHICNKKINMHSEDRVVSKALYVEFACRLPHLFIAHHVQENWDKYLHQMSCSCAGGEIQR